MPSRLWESPYKLVDLCKLKVYLDEWRVITQQNPYKWLKWNTSPLDTGAAEIPGRSSFMLAQVVAAHTAQMSVLKRRIGCI